MEYGAWGVRSGGQYYMWNYQSACSTPQIVSGGHCRGMTATHTCCAGETWYVDLEEGEMERELGVDLKRDVVTCPVPLGGK